MVPLEPAGPSRLGGGDEIIRFGHQEDVVTTGIRIGEQPRLEQSEVTKIGFEEVVEHVTEDGYDSSNRVDQHVQQLISGSVQSVP